MSTRMKCFIVSLPFMIMVLALSGCGISQDSYDQLMSESTSFQKQLEEANTRVKDLSKLNEELSAIAAYSLWYDYYYGTGAYGSDNVTEFNSQLGGLIASINDANSRSAFDLYHATHYDYSTLVDSLPGDNIWTLSQYENWRAAGEFRKEALGQVGVHLQNKLETISWFGEK